MTSMFDINSDINGYRKDSMDRLGDDLTEEVIQYLTFEDKVRLECMSKQWRRYVFNKQFVLVFDPNNDKTRNSLDRLLSVKYCIRELNVKAFESVLKKCPNIKKVILEIDIESEVLSLIGRYCPRIKSLGYRRIRYSMSGNNTNDFFRDNGHKLEELSVSETNEEFFEYLKHCPNLKTVSLDNNSFLFNDNKEFLPKLDKMRSTMIMSPYHSFYVRLMKIFSVKYSQTMKSLNVMLSSLTAEELKTCIEYISRFENLRQLSLEFGPMSNKQPIDDCLSLIGQKCTKLLKLDLNIYPSVPISDRFFAAFSEFKALKKLIIRFGNDIEVNASVEAFKHCKQLKDLDFTYNRLTEDFFANIHSIVPKLQYLHIRTSEQYSDLFINSFHSMKNIQKVFVDQKFSSDKYYYFGKCLSDVMSSPKAKHVIRVYDNCGLITRYKNY